MKMKKKIVFLCLLIFVNIDDFNNANETHNKYYFSLTKKVFKRKVIL